MLSLHSEKTENDDEEKEKIHHSLVTGRITQRTITTENENPSSKILFFILFEIVCKIPYLLKDDQTTSTALVKSIGGAMIDAVAASAAVQHFQNQQFQGLDVC